MLIFISNPSFGFWDDPNGEDHHHPSTTGTVCSGSPRVEDPFGFFCPFCYMIGRYTWVEYDSIAQGNPYIKIPDDYQRRDVCEKHGIINYNDYRIKELIKNVILDIRMRRDTIRNNRHDYLFGIKRKLCQQK